MPKCSQVFIATAFLCCGTMTDPEKSYNLEFFVHRATRCRSSWKRCWRNNDFHPHRALRKGANTVYIKAADHIEDLLTFMGAGGAAMRIMDQRLYNEMRNKTNRLSHCETANLGKSVQAAVQVAACDHAPCDDPPGRWPHCRTPCARPPRLRMQYP